MTQQRGTVPSFYQDLAKYQNRSWWQGLQQIATSVLPYLLLMAAMTYSVIAGWPYWVSLLFVVPAALFLIRVFIIFHDCTHSSFLPSQLANRIIGYVTGTLTFTPYEPWRRSHLQHHATTGQLDHRGVGDVRTMTLEEYQSASLWRRIVYRSYRHPFVMFFVGSISIFVVSHRFVGLRGTPRERRSVLATNAGLVAIALGISIPFGFMTFVATQLPVIVVAGVFGIWLFYVQHQFDPSYWARDDAWNRIDAAVHGSSHYKLPAVLRWFTGNIGIHHLHHLRPRIPNYRLYKAYREVPEASVAKPLTFWQSLKAIRYNLWSEARRRFVSFAEARRIVRRPSSGTVS